MWQTLIGVLNISYQTDEMLYILTSLAFFYCLDLNSYIFFYNVYSFVSDAGNGIDWAVRIKMVVWILTYKFRQTCIKLIACIAAN